MNKCYKILIIRNFFQILLAGFIIFGFCKCQNDDTPDQGEPIEIVFEITDPSETGKDDGSVSTEVTGGITPYSFLWSNGDTTKNIDGLTAGVYILTVNDNRSQTVKDTVTLIDVVTDVDGNTYGFVRIGDQVWMNQNLRVTRAPDSTKITSYVYDNDISNAKKYGRLYSWDAAMNGSVEEKAQGLCPCGWHIPSDDEFKILEMSLGMSEAETNMVNVWRGSPVGTKLKAGGESGYDAYMAGQHYNGRFSLLNQWEYMWTSSEYGNSAWRRCLSSTRSTIGRYNTFTKSYGFSVRCVKDD
ncbi:MAG: FISUMP domain-containing protein [Prolixibacteraceae bacterium]|nr:FISUMP domain-containing protein [Prolixibacteraceae bacterium]